MRIFPVKRTIAFIQLLLMLLLQFSATAPGYAHLLASGGAQGTRCSGDHVKCGCSPARIISKTCCCYKNRTVKTVEAAPLPSCDQSEHKQNKPSCCSKPEMHQAKKSCCSTTGETEVEAADNDERSTPAYRSIPCGSDPRFAATALDTIKFLPTCQPLMPMVSDHQTEYLLLSVSYLSQAVPPPDPPPKLS